MFINELQTALQKVYEIETPHSISDFLTSNEQLKRVLINTNGSGNETVFFRVDEGFLDIAVFLDESLVHSLNQSNMNSVCSLKSINDYCFALEGISHFLYLIYNGHYDRSFTLLEMELQAEIDKFIMLQDFALNEKNDAYDIHQLVFEQVYFREGLGPDEQSRYRKANYFAGKYCFSLLKHFTLAKDSADLHRELRRFYRLPLREKLSRIKHLH